MGRYYALHDGESEVVAKAIEDQYLPAHAGDALPTQPIGQALSLAEKLDTLIGIFAIGQRPSGAKDPFALRRAALGVVRILIERNLDLNLYELLGLAASQLADRADTEPAIDEVFDFIMERLPGYYAERGIPTDVVEAVLAIRPLKLNDFDRRVQAVKSFRTLPEAESLAAANKRIANILRQAGGGKEREISAEILKEPAERRLFEALREAEADTAPLFASGRYEQALHRLAALREPIDTFFDEVMVMSEDDFERENRLAILARLSELFLSTADIARLQT